jgi:hypothetical protein
MAEPASGISHDSIQFLFIFSYMRYLTWDTFSTIQGQATPVIGKTYLK